MQLSRFHDTFSALLSARLKPLVGRSRSLDLVSCVEIYTKVFDTLVEVVTEARIDLTNEAINYVAQCYYDGILVNGNQQLDPDIFTMRAKLENMSLEELALVGTVLSGTDFALPVIEETKRRH